LEGGQDAKGLPADRHAQANYAPDLIENALYQMPARVEAQWDWNR